MIVPDVRELLACERPACAEVCAAADAAGATWRLESSVFRHRILVVGAPASGRGWMAGRIGTLTGIPLRFDDHDLDEREWLRVADTLAQVERLQPRADLVVLMVTPVWLRWLRLFRRTLAAPRLVGPGLVARLAATRRWDRSALPTLEPLLERGPGRLVKVRSSENVRTVLECVFGLDLVATPGARQTMSST